MPDAEAGRGMKFCAAVFFVALFAAALLAAFVPDVDLAASGLFYRAGAGFFLADNPILVALHVLAVRGAWALGFGLALVTCATFFLRTNIAGISAKRWLFLLLALLIGPVLIANAGLKDHWGRARPREVIEFGGTSHFSPAYMPQAVATRNGSFISGDGAFGFFLPSYAYLVPLGARDKKSRNIFWGLMAVGSSFGLARLAMGGHFLSDILIAAILMLATATAIHAAMFSKATTRAYWRAWLGCDC